MRKIGNHLTLTLLILFLIKTLFSFSTFEFAFSLLTILVVLVSFGYSNRITKVFGGLMLVVGVFLLAFEEDWLAIWTVGVNKNLPLASLILLVPMLSIPIRLGKYDEEIANLLKRNAKKPSQMYLYISGVFFLLSPILNLGAIYLIHTMLRSIQLPVEFLGKVYLRSFLSASTWAPYFASVFLVVYFLEVPINDYILYGLLLGVLQIVVSYLIFMSTENKQMSLPPIDGVENLQLRKIVELLIFFIALISTIFFLESVVKIDIIVLITFVVAAFTLIWSLYLHNVHTVLGEMNEFFSHLFPDRVNELVLFITAGFFSVVVGNTYLGEFINQQWMFVAGKSILLVMFTTIVLVAILSFLGIHQIVSVSLLLSSVTFELAGIHPITMCMLMLSAWAVGATVSPVAPVNIAIAGVLQINAYKIIVKWNWHYVLAIIGVHTMVIYLVHVWLG